MRDKHTVQIDAEKCVGCGLCAWDCVQSNIRLTEGKAKTISPDCLMCAHCVAVCPENAVSITGFPDAPRPVKGTHPLDPEQLLIALEDRRSIRHFVKAPVEREKLDAIIEAGRAAPTASNSQRVSCLIVEHGLERVEKAAVAFMRRIKKLVDLVYPLYRSTEIDDHFLFKGAPAAIVVLAPNPVDGALAAANMALMAEAMGLGVLYSGFFTIAANRSRAVRRELKLRKGEKAATALVIGYPAVRYPRTAPKERLEVRTV